MEGGEQTLSESVSKELYNVSQTISERLEAHDKSREAVQKSIDEICGKLMNQVVELEKKTSSEIEKQHSAEESRLQTAAHDLQMHESLDSPADAFEAIQKAKAELIVEQSYEVSKETSYQKKPTRFRIVMFS